MQMVHSVSLERLAQPRWEAQGFLKVAYDGCWNPPIRLGRSVAGWQDGIEPGLLFASTCAARASSLCRHSLTGHIFSSTSSRRALAPAHLRHHVSSSSGSSVVANSTRNENDSENGGVGSCEDSPLAKEEIMFIFYQLEIERRLQRALNQDQYETAKVLRGKVTEFEQVVAKQKQEKMGSLSSKEEVQDTSIRILQLRSELQKSIQQEDYAGAARLRDKIANLEAEGLVAAANARKYEDTKYSFRLGQKIRHKKFGYRGVICGMDPVCFESADWIQQNGIQELLAGGVNQPFYQVLVDLQSNPSILVAYVAEENLVQMTEPDVDPFDHPYTYYLFYGVDAAGDFIPIRQLRDKYNAPRHEIPWEEGDDDSV